MLRRLFARVWSLRRQVTRSKPRIHRWNRWLPHLECLGARIAPAVTATFDTGTGILSILGDDAANDLLIRRDSVGNLEIRDGGITILPSVISSSPKAGPLEISSTTVSNVLAINVDAGAGDDSITIDMTNGLFVKQFRSLLGPALNPGSDLDFDLDGGADEDSLFIRGLNRNADHIDLGLMGINLNGNDELDVTHANLENFSVDGQGGADRIDAGGSSVVGAAFNQPVTILGVKGDDRLAGGANDDAINGGKGDDKMTGGLGDDTFDGGDGADRVVEKGNVDFTLTDTGLDGNGTDDLTSVENAKLTGGVDGNVIDASGFTGDVAINGMGGDDELTGGDGDDVIDGGAGDDTIDGGAGDDQADGGTGDDLINGSGGLDDLSGGHGDDTIEGGTESDLIRGDDGDDTLLGGDGDDLVEGGAGADSIDGGADTDTIRGGAGDDTINGNEGDDRLFGDDGTDTLDGGDDADLVEGGAGADNLTGGAGDDTLRGNDGTDTVVESGDVDFVLNNASLTGNGADTLSSIEQGDLTGGGGNNGIDASGFTAGPVTINAGEGSDTVQGGSRGDTLNGEGGDDSILANAGNDDIDGGDGDDTIDGGAGSDTCTNGETVTNCEA